MDTNSLEKKNSKMLFLSTVGVLTLIVAIAGATYAYFSATASNNNTITGTSAYGENSLALEVTSESDGKGKLIPQLDSAIQEAITGATGKGSCIDSNDNTICKVYSIKVTNNNSAAVVIEGKLQLVAETMDNLKWTTGTSATAGFSGTNANSKATTTLTTGTTLSGGDSATYYVVVWISETGNSQTDSGTFKGTVSFDGYVGTGENRVNGVTSTIRG